MPQLLAEACVGRREKMLALIHQVEVTTHLCYNDVTSISFLTP